MSTSPLGAVAQAATRTTPTHFALNGSAYGTRVIGGALATNSDRTAHAVVGCTNRAGRTAENHQLEQTLPGLGTASEVKTQVWTQQRNGVVSTYSRNTIARLSITANPLGSLQVNGILALSRAFHDKHGFHASKQASVQSISFTPAGGQPQGVPVPAPGQPVEIPGVATLTVGGDTRTVNAQGAKISIDALNIALTATGTETRVGHAVAAIHPGIVSGIFRGYSSGTSGELVDGRVTSGRSPNLVMPCQGTGGHVRTQSIAETHLEDNLVAQGISTRQFAAQDARRAYGYEQGRVAGINLGDGQLTVSGIVGRVNVERLKSGRLHRTITGTSLGTITANGQVQTFPATGVLEIPGVAKLDRNVVDKITNGLRVISLRVTMLDGSGAVFKLGEASLRVTPSGL
jgi:hypothetical protein